MITMPLKTASRLAEKIVNVLDPMCVRPPEIVGSIRRKRPACNDLDFVVIPKNLALVKARCKQNAATVKLDGDLNLIVIMENGVQVDIFFAHERLPDLFTPRPGNWGTLMLCRTGSVSFNRWFAMECEKRGFHWNPYMGIHGHEPSPGEARPIIASETEEEMFTALGMDFIKPEDRER